MREQFRSSDAAYFVSTQTAGRKPFFRHERWARLMMATIRRYAEKDFLLHAYVIMPDHLHLLISPAESVEKAVQLIKGGFSFRAKRELDWKFDIWQPGFTDHRMRDAEDWKRHLDYMRSNPIEARLVEDSALYEYMGFPNIAFPQGLKPRSTVERDVRAEARTLHSEARPFQASVSPDFPQGLKPGELVAGEDVRAEARTIHPDTADLFHPETAHTLDPDTARNLCSETAHTRQPGAAGALQDLARHETF